MTPCYLQKYGASCFNQKHSEIKVNEQQSITPPQGRTPWGVNNELNRQESTSSY